MSGVKGLSVCYPFPLSLFLSPQYFCLWAGEELVFRHWLRWGHCSWLWMPVWILLLWTCPSVLWLMFKKFYLYAPDAVSDRYRFIPLIQSYPGCNNTVPPWKSAGGILHEVDQMKVSDIRGSQGVRDSWDFHSILLVNAARQIIKRDSNLWHTTVASRRRTIVSGCHWRLKIYCISMSHFILFPPPNKCKRPQISSASYRRDHEHLSFVVKISF